jgi:hypothetical protein
MKIKRGISSVRRSGSLNSYGNLFGIFGEAVPAFDHAKAERVGGAVEALADWPTECTGSRRRTADPPSRLGDFPDLRLINRRS